MENLTRSISNAPELIWVERDGTKRPVIRGIAAVFYNGSPETEFNVMGALHERFAPGAFRDVLQNNPDVFGRVDHLATKTFARTPRLKLWEDSRGLNFEAELTRSTTCQDLLTDFGEGIYKGCSLRFGADLRNPSNASWSREGDKEVVTIRRVAALRDVAVVQEPAYSGTELSIYRSARDCWIQDEATKKRLAMLDTIKTAQAQQKNKR